MKNKFLIALFLFSLLTSCEESKNSETAKEVSEETKEEKPVIDFLVADRNVFTIDKEGNYYVQGPAMFAKAGANGNIQFHITPKDMQEATVSVVKVNDKGEIFAAGLLYPQTFGTPQIDLTQIEMSGPHFFVAKFNPMGTIEWIKNGTNGNRLNPEILYLSKINDIELDKNGNIYFIGKVITNTCIGDQRLFPETRAKHNESLLESDDILFGKMDSTGNMVWVKRIGSTTWPGYDHPNDRGNDITLDKEENVIIAGGVFGKAVCDKDTFITESSSLHPFVAKYSPDGNFMFQRSVTKSLKGIGKVVVDSDNNIIASGENGVFLVKYDKTGKELWYKEVNGANPKNVGLWGDALALLPNGDIITGGSFEKKAIIDSAFVVNTFEEGFPDVFVSIYDKDGKLKIVQSFGKNEFTYGDRIFNLIPHGDKILIAGDFGGSPVANTQDQLVRQAEWLYSFNTSQSKAPVYIVCRGCKGKGGNVFNGEFKRCGYCDGTCQELQK